jgi:hypothetical protein
MGLIISKSMAEAGDVEFAVNQSGDLISLAP